MKTDKHEIVYEMYFNEYEDEFIGEKVQMVTMGINQMVFVNDEFDIEDWILIPR